MKITKQELANIIKEEVEKALGESDEQSMKKALKNGKDFYKEAQRLYAEGERGGTGSDLTRALKISLDQFQEACNLGSIEACQSIPKVKKMIDRLH